MAYATLQDLTNELAPEVAASLAYDGDGTPDIADADVIVVINDLLEKGARIVDGYASSQMSVPLTEPVDDQIVHANIEIAIDLLYGRRPGVVENPRANLVESTFSFLDALRHGIAKIQVAGATEPKRRIDSTTDDTDPTFTMETLAAL